VKKLNSFNFIPNKGDKEDIYIYQAWNYVELRRGVDNGAAGAAAAAPIIGLVVVLQK